MLQYSDERAGRSLYLGRDERRESVECLEVVNRVAVP
jgi:hypothetical protein